MMSKISTQKLLTIVLFFILSGCSSMKPLEQGLSPLEIVAKINPGDEIIVHTTDNQKHLIVVESITEEVITGSGRTFEYQNIAEINKEGIDALRTTGAIVGGAYIWLSIATILFLSGI